MNNIDNFKVGQAIQLSNGKIYPIVKVTKESFFLMNDAGETEEYPSNYFKDYILKDYFAPRVKINTLNEFVNHPSHYNREGSMECIEEMELIFGKEAVRHFCILNAWKYRYRAMDKNGKEDMRKADWYIKKLKELDMPF